MTSQKRYRHHQDGDNNSARFRDIPPRFKRQKSSSSPTRASTPPETSKVSLNINTRDMQEIKSPQSKSLIGSVASYSKETDFYQFEEKLTSYNRPVTEIQSATHPVITKPTMWQSPQESSIAFFSSPWNIYQASVNFQEPSHISLGTHFGCKANRSALSQWASESAAKHGEINNLAWVSSVNDPFVDKDLQYPSDFYGNNENGTYNQYSILEHSPRINWSMQTSSHEHYPATLSPTLKSSKLSLSVETNENIKSVKGVKKDSFERTIDYKDSDVRTIEMLRELERVADQKESENEEFGSDRKSLVSHHLRMLMCAVDRYTEGIEDELAVMSRNDEVTPSSDSRASTPGVSSAPSKMWKNEPINETAEFQQKQDKPLFFSPNSKMAYAWDQTVSPVKNHAIATNQNNMSLLPASLHTSPLMNEHKDALVQESAAWDLWSSPSFDFCDVLMNQSPWNSGIKDKKKRMPLYQRQMLNF